MDMPVLNPMQEKSLRVLEFTKIRERLATHAITQTGANLCLSLLPYERLAEVNQALAETEEAVIVLTYRGDQPLVDFKDVRPALHLAGKGATLSTRVLLDIADCLRAASVARTALDTDKDNTPILKGLSQALMTNYPLERGIKDAIISEEEIADNASHQLADIRRQMRLCNDRIKEKLRTMTQQLLLQIPAGAAGDSSKRSIRDSGQAGVPPECAGACARSVIHRRHPVYRAYGRGGNRQ